MARPPPPVQCCCALDLPRRMATIYPQIRSSHEATGITDQEHRGTSILMRQTQLSKHILLRPLTSSLWKLLEQSFNHGRYDVSGTDCVNSDTVLAPFTGEIACELENARFASVVGWTDQALEEITVSMRRNEVATEGAYLVGDCAAHRSNENYAASTAPSNHFLCYCLCCHEHTSYIDLLTLISVRLRLND